MIFFCFSLYNSVFRLTYESQHLENRLPKGVETNDETFHGGIHKSRVYPMHSCSIFSNDTEFVANVRPGAELCDIYLHTDYCLKVCSTKLFVRSIRNQNGKFVLLY